MIQIVVPALGESVTEATVAKWFKNVGDAVAADEPLVELETDKVTVEVPAPAAGVLRDILAAKDSVVTVGAPLCTLEEGAAAAPSRTAAAEPVVAPVPAATPATTTPSVPAMPSAQKMMQEKKVDPQTVSGTGKDGRITKGDVIAHLEPAPTPAPTAVIPASESARSVSLREERVQMTRLRKRIAERLKDAQNTAAMLTTFNEVDMTALNDIRARYKDIFEKKHGVKLGFMSFFVKAAVRALKEWPAVNAEIDGDDIVYKNHYDIGVAVGTPNGLVVPVVRDADNHNVKGCIAHREVP